VLFGTTTNYGLLDIYSGSPYYPRRDPLALERITAALEPLGLVDNLTVTSSDSGGLYLYFPFSEAISSWQLAIALSALLENAGFKIHMLHAWAASDDFILKAEALQQLRQLGLTGL
jgi:hypothetical protein